MNRHKIVPIILLVAVALLLALPHAEAVGLRCKQIINSAAAAAATGENVVAARARKMNELLARDTLPDGTVPGWPPEMIDKLEALDIWYENAKMKLDAEYVERQNKILAEH